MRSGHSIIAVPIPELDSVVRERTAFYDASFVSSDPGFVHAHVTVLGPWDPAPSEVDLARVASIAGGAAPFRATFASVGEFDDGIIHLLPQPDQPLRALTRALARAFPAFPPYAGEFPDSVPHLTLDRRSACVTRESVERSLASLLPLTVTIDRLDLQWWANDDCRLLHSWPLGGNDQ